MRLNKLLCNVRWLKHKVKRWLVEFDTNNPWNYIN